MFKKKILLKIMLFIFTISALFSAVSVQAFDPTVYSQKGTWLLPKCVFDQNNPCRNVNDLLQLLVNFGAGTFAIIGVFAFVFFVYGGLTMIMSFGNAEKVKKGRDTLLAAVIGLVIAFSAFLMVKFVLNAMHVSNEFRATEFQDSATGGAGK